ncbi:hypothetical protein [Halorussus pelagicus]|uniref:hypothetical protein n=1 Tax=Halorussus pelagicus TaxID=2505977 RepID=UPI000FFB56FF|nr:hypothetical protein [Halorussus pelagicus]
MNTDRSRGRSLKPSLALFVLVAVSPAIRLYDAGTVSWPWLGLGVVSWAAAAGPVAASRFGQRVESWFESIGVGGRAAIIVALAIVIWGSMFAIEPPTLPTQSYLLGGMVGLVSVEIWQKALSE